MVKTGFNKLKQLAFQLNCPCFFFLHKSQQPQRPLPQPPKGGPPGGDLPASRSPRVRRRYKVQTSASRSHYAEEEEEEEEDDKSTADSEIR